MGSSSSGISDSGGGGSGDHGVPVGAVLARNSDNGFANGAPLAASVVVTQVAFAAGATGGTLAGAKIGRACGPVWIAVGAIVGGLVGGLAAFFTANTVQSTFDWDVGTLGKGIHWGVHIGDGKIIELLDDGNLHVAWVNHGLWEKWGIICKGGQKAANKARNAYHDKRYQGYNLATNNCRDFCRRCCK